MRPVKLKSKLFCVMGVLMSSCLLNAEIFVYDLTYTLKVDYSKSVNVHQAWDHCHSIATLQGIVNRKSPRLYLKYIESQHLPLNIDLYWLDKNMQKGAWLEQSKIRNVVTVESLFNQFKDDVNGLVVYDSNVPATSNVASAVAGAEGLIAVRYDKTEGSMFHLLKEKLKFPVKVWLINTDGSSKFTGKGKISDIERYSTGSPKCDAYLWMKEKYLETDKLNPTNGAYYIDYYWTKNPTRIPVNHHNLTNHDYFVSQKAWFFDLNVWADESATDEPGQVPGTDRNTLKEILLSCYRKVNGEKMIYIGGFPPWAHKYTKSAGFRHPDVATEWEYCAIISAYNAYKDADAIGYGAMANASFWQHFPLQEKYSQKWVSHEELKAKGYLTKDGKVDFKGRQFYIFYVGDYDSSAWLYQRMPDLWEDPNRGKVPMMWAISPVLEKRVPMVMDYIRSTASENDYFVAADNGAGYINPGALCYSKYYPDQRAISGLPDGLEVWKSHCKRYYNKWGLTISGFVIDGFSAGMGLSELDVYKEFSPDGVVVQTGPFSYLHRNMPVLRNDTDIVSDNPNEAADILLERAKARPIPFHWFRNILKSPTWYVQVHDAVEKKAPELELLDAPTFFELLRIYLKDNPDAANGKYPYYECLWN